MHSKMFKNIWMIYEINKIVMVRIKNVMNKTIVFLLSLIFLSCIKTLTAQGEDSPYARKMLDNGLAVVVKEIPQHPTVSINVLVKNGSAVEDPYLGSGITHFLEHMIFKGTKNYGVGELAKTIQANGGYVNASTSFDYTSFKVDLPAESMEIGLSVLSQMMSEATIDKDEFIKEKDVILKEMHLYNDDPQRQLSKMIFETLYRRHPYRYPIIGEKEIFKTLTYEDLKQYYQERYVSNQMVLAIVGGIEEREAFDLAEKYFSKHQPGHYVLRNLPKEPKQIGPREATREFQTAVTHLSYVVPGVSILHADLFALDLLAIILGQGESSRLYSDIVKNKELAFSVATFNYSPVDEGLFEINCQIKEDDMQDVVAEIERHIRRVQQKGVDVAEIEKAKQKLISDHVYRMQDAHSQAFEMVFGEAFAGDHRFYEKYLQGIQAVVRQDIQNVAQKYFTKDRINIVTLIPRNQKKEDKKVKDKNEPGKISKTVLPNGATLILKKNSLFPSISLSLVARGGVREESLSLNGLFNLLKRTWTKGTRKYSREKMARLIEEKGARLSPFSGNNSFGLQAKILKKDADFIMDMMDEVIHRPLFAQKQIDQEKNAIFMHIKEKENSVFHKTYIKMKKLLFDNHPYSMDSLGTIESVANIKREDILNYYDKYMVPDNLVISIVGDFDEERMRKLTREKFGEQDTDTVSLPNIPVSSSQESETYKQTIEKEQAMIMVGFLAPAIDEDSFYAMSVLSEILASPLSGRLFQNIRDQFGQSYRLGGNYVAGIDSGYVFFYVATTNKHIDQIERIIHDEIERIRKELIDEKELREIKTYVKGIHQMGLADNSSVSFQTALDELYTLGYDRHQRHGESIDQVTAQVVMTLAQEIFTDKNRVTVKTLSDKETDY